MMERFTQTSIGELEKVKLRSQNYISQAFKSLQGTTAPSSPSLPVIKTS